MVSVVLCKYNEVAEGDKTVTTEVTAPPCFAVVTGEGDKVTEGNSAIGVVVCSFTGERINVVEEDRLNSDADRDVSIDGRVSFYFESDLSSCVCLLVHRDEVTTEGAVPVCITADGVNGEFKPACGDSWSRVACGILYCYFDMFIHGSISGWAGDDEWHVLVRQGYK